MADISVPTTIAPVFDGTINTQVVEFLSPDTTSPTNVIRLSQNWAIRVNWEMHGDPFMLGLANEFHLRAHVESIGPGPELLLPQAAPVVIGTLSVPATPIAGGQVQRAYTADIPVNAGTLPVGTYKIVTILHLAATGGTPHYAVAGMFESEVVDIFLA